MYQDLAQEVDQNHVHEANRNHVLKVNQDHVQEVCQDLDPEVDLNHIQSLDLDPDQDLNQEMKVNINFEYNGLYSKLVLFKFNKFIQLWAKKYDSEVMNEGLLFISV